MTCDVRRECACVCVYIALVHELRVRVVQHSLIGVNLQATRVKQLRLKQHVCVCLCVCACVCVCVCVCACACLCVRSIYNISQCPTTSVVLVHPPPHMTQVYVRALHIQYTYPAAACTNPPRVTIYVPCCRFDQHISN